MYEEALASVCVALEARWLGPAGLISREAVAQVLLKHGIDACDRADELLSLLNNPLFRRRFRKPARSFSDSFNRILAHLRATLRDLPVALEQVDFVVQNNDRDDPTRRQVAEMAASLKQVEDATRNALPLLEVILDAERSPDTFSPAILISMKIREYSQRVGKRISQRQSVVLAVDLIDLMLPEKGSRSGWIAPPTASGINQQITRARRCGQIV